MGTICLIEAGRAKVEYQEGSKVVPLNKTYIRVPQARATKCTAVVTDSKRIKFQLASGISNAMELLATYVALPLFLLMVTCRVVGCDIPSQISTVGSTVSLVLLFYW